MFQKEKKRRWFDNSEQQHTCTTQHHTRTHHSSDDGGGSYYDDDTTTTTTTTTSESKDYDDYYDDPYSTFDISDCTAYSNTWLWDLTLTCDPDDLENLTNCQCSTAQNLFDAGIIECAENSSSSPPACPADCTVCQTCMVLLGCPDIYPKNTSNNLRHSQHHVSTAGKFAMMTMLASAVGPFKASLRKVCDVLLRNAMQWAVCFFCCTNRNL